MPNAREDHGSTSRPSVFSDTHGVTTHGGQYNAAGRDIHLHYHNSPGGDVQHQPPRDPQANEASTSHQFNEYTDSIAGSIARAYPSLRRILSFQPSSLLRLPDLSRLFRTRSLDAEIVSIVEAEYTSLMSRSSSAASTIPKDSEMYLRLMLKHRHGYPLYRPEPKRTLPREYRKKGIRIGDVGRITPDGAFDFLFNVDSSQASSINPPILPQGFETIPPIEILPEGYFFHDAHLLSDHVKQTNNQPITYKFFAAEGTVLQLPEGATLFEAGNMNDLYNLALRHARNWYEYMAMNRSRDVPNGSLYLITGCIKTKNWGIGAFYGFPVDSDYLEFTSADQADPQAYNWRKSGPILAKTGPTLTDVIVESGDEPNQCVFIRGYKITLGEKMWKKIKKSVSVSSSKGATGFPVSPLGGSGSKVNPGNSSNFLYRQTHGRSSPPHTTHSLSTESLGDQESISPVPGDSVISNTVEESERGPLQEFFTTISASPIHPLDPISAMLLCLEPEAEVILVHDNDWRNLLPENFAVNPDSLKIKDLLENVARSYLVAIDTNSCVSLVRKPAADLEQFMGLAPIEEGVPGARFEARKNLCSDLPTELVAYILDDLDFRSMAKCRTVCKKFRNLIDRSRNFHWKMELAIAGKVDGGAHSLATRREMLERHQQGWNHLLWTSELRQKMMHGGLWDLCGDTLIQSTPDGDAIHFTRLPSKSRNIEEKDWIVDLRGLSMQDYTLDAPQDLLIIVEKPQWQQGVHTYRIVFWSLSTGEPHPLARGMLMHTSSREQVMRNYWPTQTCGDHLCIFFDDSISKETEIKIWNWKTGQTLADIVGEGVMAMTHLNERYMMFGILRTEPSLVVVDFIAEHPTLRRLEEVENIYTFRFPPVKETVEVLDFIIQGDTAHGWSFLPKARVPFFTPHRDRLYVINIIVNTTKAVDRQVQLYALGNTFLSLIEATGQKAARFDWAEWGPSGTRMISPEFGDSHSYPRSAYGTKHVSTRKAEGHAADHVHVYDFNQLALRWGEKNFGSLGMDAGDEGQESLEYSNITTPTTIADKEVFDIEVETTLGYRMKRWPIPGKPRVQAALCSEDGIVIVHGQDMAEEFQIMTV